MYQAVPPCHHVDARKFYDRAGGKGRAGVDAAVVFGDAAGDGRQVCGPDGDGAAVVESYGGVVSGHDFVQTGCARQSEINRQLYRVGQFRRRFRNGDVLVVRIHIHGLRVFGGAGVRRGRVEGGAAGFVGACSRFHEEHAEHRTEHEQRGRADDDEF